MIIALHKFWGQHGCFIRQGYDLEMGAGTFNPSTFLGSLGPEPINVAYVEPCRRPTDGRYGENPNRLQHYYQYQVLLKPSPENIQTLYLDSLKTMGINWKNHDIRFVHDDWESPTLGASGLGWEVWLNGMEITQFTYFQQVGGIGLKPISGEITYGLERIAMYIQEVDSVFDLMWTDQLTYGEVHHQSEVEFSKYNFETATPDLYFKLFDSMEKEAQLCVKEEIILPAYDMVMKASHVFNMLDARGLISVNERMGYILRIRKLANLIATSYIKKREQMGFPLLLTKNAASSKTSQPTSKGREKIAKENVAVENITKEKNTNKNTITTEEIKTGIEDLVLEIGSEELPAKYVPIGMENLKKAIKDILDKEKLNYKSIQAKGTPRRLTVYVESLQGEKPQIDEIRKGPPLNRFYDDNDQPTKMAIGFAKKLGVEVPSKQNLLSATETDSFFIRDVAGVPYIHSRFKIEAKNTVSILAASLPSTILSVSFPKKMRWGNGDIEYARPIRWILCLHGKTVVPFSVGNISSNRESEGHPLLSAGTVIIDKAQNYDSLLEDQKVIIDHDQRKKMILSDLEKIEKAKEAYVPHKEKVLKEVIYLNEYPFIQESTFPSSYLETPKELLISEMVEHQKYFALVDQKENKLLNEFVITANNLPNERILKGNQKVLNARLADGAFMYQEDLKISPDKRIEQLKSVTHLEGLGSMYDKVQRIGKHAEILLSNFQRDSKLVQRAALLCKSDLTSHVVYDFPELQGIMGKYYAQHNGENEEVASSIEEHYRPTGIHDSVPNTSISKIVALADKIDNLLSCFGMGHKPAATSDPFALRRQMLGIIRILLEGKISLPIFECFESCYDNFEGKLRLSKGEVLKEIQGFMVKRIETVFTRYALSADEIAASVSVNFTDIYDLYEKIQALKKFRTDESFEKLLLIYKRCTNIISKEKSISKEIDPSMLREDVEKKMYDVITSVSPKLLETIKNKKFHNSYQILASLWPYLDDLFDAQKGVKILVEDTNLRANRIALLRQITEFMRQLLDFSKIVIAK